MATLKSLQARIAKLQSQAETMMKTNSKKVVAQIHSLMHEHGLTMEDIGEKFKAKTPSLKPTTKSVTGKSGAAAKYMDPKSGATWSGHGRAPGWIASAKNRDKFLVEGTSASAPVAAKKAVARPGNYVRGPQPAKYRDPRSGAEWSGRGKAPSWLAGAKNRSKFLIQGAAFTAQKPMTKATKSGPVVKKAALKRAATKKVVSETSTKNFST
jgi:DNA-binding protein H-NS